MPGTEKTQTLKEKLLPLRCFLRLDFDIHAIHS
jgi:hypothetical protein